MQKDFYKLTKTTKKGEEVIFTNDTKLINQSRKKGLNIIHIGTLSEKDKEKYRGKGITIIDTDEVKK